MLLKILGVGVCSVVINIVLKQYKPEYAMLSNVCGGLIIFFMVLDGAKELINSFVTIQDMFGLNFDVVTPVLKIVGVGYVVEFSCDLAEDCGNKLIADKLLLGGKIAICVLALPIIKSLINSILLLIK